MKKIKFSPQIGSHGTPLSAYSYIYLIISIFKYFFKCPEEGCFPLYMQWPVSAQIQ